jgi:hypothetical protein
MIEPMAVASTFVHSSTLPGAGPSGAVDLRPRFFRGETPHATASSIDTLVKDGDQIDPIGLATVLTLGTALGGRTAIAGIRATEIDTSGFALAHAPSDGDFLRLVLDAIERRALEETPVCLLSGGRDSRLIALGHRRLGARLELALTLDQYGGQSDAAIACRLAEHLEIPIERVRPLPFDGAREVGRHMMQSFQSLEHGWFLPIAMQVRSMNVRVTDGIGAGVLSTGSLLGAEPVRLWNERRVDELCEWMVGHAGGASRRWIDGARSAGIAIASHDEVLHEFSRVMRGLEGQPNPLGMFSLLHWSRRGIASSAFGLLPEDRVVAPLYDLELCRAIAAVPMERAMRRDWREIALESLDDSGLPFATGEDTRVPRWVRNPLRTIRSKYAWQRLCGELPQPLARLAADADLEGGDRKSFNRAAIGLIAALDCTLGCRLGTSGRVCAGGSACGHALHG